ncbi:MAG: peroxiredoxin [Betaproteobacteria bacterium]|nr:peroxiredoxin [Betaproteobacteria bacterium]
MNAIEDFTLPATGNQRFSSAVFRGHRYVLYFYPKDDTPGCTLEGTQFKALHGEFLEAGVMVFGVSRDSVVSHERFKAKMGYPFDLLSDPDETVCKLFDVIREKSLYGRKYMGVDRSTFLMGPRHEILREWRSVKVDGHAAAVLEAVKSV